MLSLLIRQHKSLYLLLFYSIFFFFMRPTRDWGTCLREFRRKLSAALNVIVDSLRTQYCFATKPNMHTRAWTVARQQPPQMGEDRCRSFFFFFPPSEFEIWERRGRKAVSGERLLSNAEKVLPVLLCCGFRILLFKPNFLLPSRTLRHCVTGRISLDSMANITLMGYKNLLIPAFCTSAVSAECFL